MSNSASSETSSNKADPHPKRVRVGFVSGAHGVKGLVFLKLNSDDSPLFAGDIPVYLSEDSDKALSITLKGQKKGGYIAALETITDRNQAEALKGSPLFISYDALPGLDENEFYYDELIGRPVQDEAGNSIGQVLAVENFGASDLLEIKQHNGKSFYVPLTEDFVPVIADIITIQNYQEFLT